MEEVVRGTESHCIWIAAVGRVIRSPSPTIAVPGAVFRGCGRVGPGVGPGGADAAPIPGRKAEWNRTRLVTSPHCFCPLEVTACGVGTAAGVSVFWNSLAAARSQGKDMTWHVKLKKKKN